MHVLSDRIIYLVTYHMMIITLGVAAFSIIFHIEPIEHKTDKLYAMEPPDCLLQSPSFQLAGVEGYPARK